MISFDDVIYGSNTKHNPNWPSIPDHPYVILIIAGSKSGKSNLLLNLISYQPDIDKLYHQAKDPFEANINC